jgi:glycosyltransferase involved in cell wall biosynthesis
MKIVHVTPYYPPHLGGVEIVAQRLSEALATRGHNVNVITSNISQEKRCISKKNVTVETQLAFEFAHTPFAPTLPISVCRTLKNADVLHVHAGIAYYPEVCAVAAKILRIPFVVTFHCDTEPASAAGFLLPIYNALFLKNVLRSADCVVCLTKDHAEIVRKKYGVRENKIKVIPNGIDDLFFTFQHPPIKRAKKNDTIKLLFVGRLAKQKNVPRLIEAVRIVAQKHPVLLRIIGTGEEENSIKELVGKYGFQDKVIFLGKYKREEFADRWKRVFRDTDIFVISSDYEGIPTTLLEAMAAGVPTIATNVRGICEFANGIAELAEPNAQSIAAAIDKLSYDQPLRRLLSNKARATVQKFKWKKTAEMYEKVYMEVMK